MSASEPAGKEGVQEVVGNTFKESGRAAYKRYCITG